MTEYLIYIHTKGGCDDDNSWSWSFLLNNTCRGCGALRTDVREGPVDVVLQHRPDKDAVTSSGASLIGIVREDFRELFEPDFSEHMHLGRVLDSNRNVYDGFSTFISSRPIAIRGGPASDRRVCDLCGRLVYGADPPRYVIRSSLTGQRIYNDGYSGLLVVRELASRIDPRERRRVWIEKLPILDQPRDGIKDFPENWF